MSNMIVVYGKGGCIFTAAVKKEPSRREKPYEYHNVTKEQDALHRMLELTGGTRLVPVIVERGNIKIGFGGTCEV